MKKLATLLLAAGMVLGGFTGAQAIDWKTKGNWQFEFAYSDGLQFVRNSGNRTPGSRHPGRYGGGYNSGNMDNFTAMQRINIQVDAVASESLSGTIFFEIGHTHWGKEGVNGMRTDNGSMGQRGVNVGVRRAYMDFIVPNVDLQIRMGIQSLNNPSYTFGPLVIGEDVAALTATYKFNDNVSLTAFWARPYNDNWVGNNGYNAAGVLNTGFANNGVNAHREAQGSMDNIDLFGLVLPLSFDGFKLTPWGIIGAIGPNTFRTSNTTLGDTGLTSANNSSQRNQVLDGMFPRYYSTHHKYRADGNYGSRDYATAWWAALTGEITAADPFRFAFEGIYGSFTHADAGYLDRRGWFLNVLAEYKLDWGVPGIYGWWGSGDNGNPRDGSERLPVFSVNSISNNMLSTFGFSGDPSVGGPYDGIFGQSGHAGTWGIGARIRDMSFLEGLTHTLRVNLMGGTNDPAMAKYILGKKVIGGDPWRSVSNGPEEFNGNLGGSGSKGIYLTRLDYALEVNFDTLYKIYDNLDMIVELGYIHLWLDQSSAVWGSGWNMTGAVPTRMRGVSVTDAVKAAVFFRYSF